MIEIDNFLLDNDILETIINKEMSDQGLDPLNREDVNRFWASKGVEIDNANVFIQR